MTEKPEDLTNWAYINIWKINDTGRKPLKKITAIFEHEVIMNHFQYQRVKNKKGF